MQLLGVEIKWNIPNLLSLLRIVLVPVFMVLYLLRYDMWSFGVLLLSGLSDVLDGIIARRCNQITDFGKLLDPIADKLTQVAVVICLATRYPSLMYLALLCLAKELCQAIGGFILLRKRSTVRGSKWFGKLSTVVFYTCMLAIVLWDEKLHPVVWWSLVSLAGLCMLLAFAGYMRLFIRLFSAGKDKEDSAAPATEPEKG